ncbi:MAG: NADH-quinone oxidoreductase subunit B family protein [Candidatus Methylomirabilia bacterium]
MWRPKTAFFDLSCCEGCQLQVVNAGETLLEIVSLVDIVEFREVLSETWDGELDVAFVEGSVTDEHAAGRLEKIRARTKILVALGSCATIGGVNGMKNAFDPAEVGRVVYGEDRGRFPAAATRPLHQVVPVDCSIHGCPIFLPEFLAALKCILSGNPYAVPDQAVCTECKRNENVCLFERGVTCLGPVTRAGCDSWCVNSGNICYGCRGLVSNPNEKGMLQVLAAHGVSLEQVVKKMEMYNRCRGWQTATGQRP